MDANTTPMQQKVSTETDDDSEFNGLALGPVTRAAILQQRQEQQHETEIVLYSDGSLIEAGTEKCSMTFGVATLLENNIFAPLMSGEVAGFASSTKTELVGHVAAVLCSPRNATVKIYIDNMAVVQMF
ncbi:hypothetical protein BGZ81_005323 [Podila clonocystis]|nr:hypothetical protein BGZ81_005323 [Podila clonocystis]